MLAASGAGSKDMGKSLFSVWEDIFCAPNARNKTSVNKADFGNIYLKINGEIYNTHFTNLF